MPEAKLKRLLQIGIIVPDAALAAKNFCTLFDIAESAIKITDTTETAAPIRVHGQEMTAYFILAVVRVAQIEFEFIQPNGGKGGISSQQEYLDEHGAGIQHICIDVDNYQDALQRMEDMGGEVLSAGGEGAFSYRYMDLRDSMGLIFEVYNDGLRDAMTTNR